MLFCRLLLRCERVAVGVLLLLYCVLLCCCVFCYARVRVVVFYLWYVAFVVWCVLFVLWVHVLFCVVGWFFCVFAFFFGFRVMLYAWLLCSKCVVVFMLARCAAFVFMVCVYVVGNVLCGILLRMLVVVRFLLFMLCLYACMRACMVLLVYVYGRLLVCIYV